MHRWGLDVYRYMAPVQLYPLRLYLTYIVQCLDTSVALWQRQPSRRLNCTVPPVEKGICNVFVQPLVTFNLYLPRG